MIPEVNRAPTGEPVELGISMFLALALWLGSANRRSELGKAYTTEGLKEG